MSLTPAQQEAIQARGNVLVVAGAGTGKTRTLVERCLNCLLEGRPRASLDELLMVTFTEAAAAEMRQRIRSRLEQELARHPGDSHWQEQLALFENAHIGTLHSFCLQLVRQHFFELALDPALAVLDEAEARLLAEETLDGLLKKAYSGQGPMAEAVQQLVQIEGRGWDKPVRTLTLKLHRYSQSLPNPSGWFEQQLQIFESPEPVLWLEWLMEAINRWRLRWTCRLQSRADNNNLAAGALAALHRMGAQPTRREASSCLTAIDRIPGDCPRGKKGEWFDPIHSFFEEAAFLACLAQGEGKDDPLMEDWQWTRGKMSTLLELAREFTDNFSTAKRELGLVDFQDLEQHALRLLWDAQAAKPTAIALEWRRKLRFVFVDEYQDINAAQDKIIEALSREGADANRFLVGDVKQSIYRFRLANPRIFQGYIDSWSAGAARAIPLTENFRSREGLLNFFNALFGFLMKRELGGVPYDQRAALRFGAASERQALSAAADSRPRVELHLRLKGAGDNNGRQEENGELPSDIKDLLDAEKEARLVAFRLRELRDSGEIIWDDGARQFRPVDWRDMAVLLRSPASKADCYAKEFGRMNIPLQVIRGGFYRSLEITDLLAVLELLDNPLQDLPAIAVLRSPLVGLSLDELATIRLAAPKTRFWTALTHWQEQGQAASSATGTATARTDRAAREKVSQFLERFSRWRRLARQVSLSRCLESVLAETHYADWLLTQDRGEQRHANVRRLQVLAEEFDQFQRQGLFRFLRFIEAQRLAEMEPEVPAVPEQNSVRLMSIHQSKGLEFPVVAVADLGKSFNRSDLSAEVILDEQYGLCPQIQPPHTGKRYPSLPYWMARQRQNEELLGEELRLLYVAATRARDVLLLSGTISKTKLEKIWQAAEVTGTEALLAAGSYADWLGLWCAQSVGPIDGKAGENAWLRWAFHEDSELTVSSSNEPTAVASASEREPDPALIAELQGRLSWQYPFTAATRQPAKSSVSQLRRSAAAAEETEAAEVAAFVNPQRKFQAGSREGERTGGSKVSAVDVGTAHHLFLELLSLEASGTQVLLEQESTRLQREGLLTAAEAASLDFAALAAFWGSGLGQRIRAQSRLVQRELPFTMRCSPLELAQITGQAADPAMAEEFVVVQGVTDLAVLLPKEIWLVDFKTDAVRGEQVAERAKQYAPQLKLYSRALSQIYKRPVTEAWLWFLTARQGVPIENPKLAGAAQAQAAPAGLEA